MSIRFLVMVGAGVALVATTVLVALLLFTEPGEGPAQRDGEETVPPGGGDPVLVGAGDIAKCSTTGDEATANLLDGIGGTVFTLGDNAYAKGTEGQYDHCYDPSWGRHKARTKPSIGNHEYETADASGYYDYFSDYAGESGEGYYSYDVGEWHVVVLNINCEDVEGGCATGSPQERWLTEDLADNPSDCTVAYFHQPLFSSGEHGNNEDVRPLWETLYGAGADVVLSAHDHLYERFAPQDPSGQADPERGIRQFIVGTGGGGLDPFEDVQPNSEVRIAQTHGVLKLALHEKSYDWRFIPVAGSSESDSGSGQCHGAPAS